MCRYVVIIVVVGLNAVSAPPPLRLTIDCGSADKGSSLRPFKSKSSDHTRSFDVNTFCGFIHSAIPKAVKDGKFILIEDLDQSGFSNDQIPIVVAPPKGFIPKLGPKFKRPGVRVPKINVPKLKRFEGPLAPRVGSSMYIPRFRDSADEESSAEKMEKFKKGVQKMLHVVKVLGQIDQYLSERTRIIIEKLTKTFAE